MWPGRRQPRRLASDAPIRRTSLGGGAQMDGACPRDLDKQQDKRHQRAERTQR